MSPYSLSTAAGAIFRAAASFVAAADMGEAEDGMRLDEVLESIEAVEVEAKGGNSGKAKQPPAPPASSSPIGFESRCDDLNIPIWTLS